MSLLNQAAPDFNLLNSKLEHVKLSDLRGKKVIVVFYPPHSAEFATKRCASFRKTSPS